MWAGEGAPVLGSGLQADKGGGGAAHSYQPCIPLSRPHVPSGRSLGVGAPAASTDRLSLREGYEQNVKQTANIGHGGRDCGEVHCFVLGRTPAEGTFKGFLPTVVDITVI